MLQVHRGPAGLFVWGMVLAAGWIFAGPVRAQQTLGAFQDVREIPDSPGGKRLKELLDVLNSGDAERIKKFVTEAFTPHFQKEPSLEEHVAFFQEFRRVTGGVDFYAVRKYQEQRPPDEIMVVVRARTTEQWRGIRMEVEPDAPHRIAGLRFAPARPPTDLPDAGKKLSETEMIEQIKQYLERLVKNDAFSGTVLVAKDGQVFFQQAYGLADKNFGVPNKLDTKFNLGSMNKMFTAVAIAQLAERGKLRFDDPISKYLASDWLPPEVAGKITIEHLLTHTSGLGSYFHEKFDQSSRALFRTVNDYKPLVAGEKPAFEPGTRFQYSNTGFLLLGAIVEKAAGEDYFEYIRKNIYKPAGMVNSDCYEMDKVTPNLAIGYSRASGSKGDMWENNLYKHVIRGGPAGGGFSTVEDLLKFDRALRANKLLGKELTEKLWTPTPESWSQMAYGCGFGIQGTADNRIVGHTGGFPGISAALEMHLGSGYTVAVLSNYDQAAVTVTQKIVEFLNRREK